MHLNRVRWLSLPEPHGVDAAVAGHISMASAVGAGGAGRDDKVLPRLTSAPCSASCPRYASGFPATSTRDEEDLPALPDTTGLTIGWQAGQGRGET